MQYRRQRGLSDARVSFPVAAIEKAAIVHIGRFGAAMRICIAHARYPRVWAMFGAMFPTPAAVFTSGRRKRFILPPHWDTNRLHDVDRDRPSPGKWVNGRRAAGLGPFRIAPQFARPFARVRREVHGKILAPH